ncbi:MucR family transcriptional regulator [Methylobacterium sp. J-076]|uniref:MucR family transcriptional regulator n=1 Tax=Methylobacterium sp. J-076 TaxID=2836655 RepID=UPI00244379D2|nr:MucR family transcriptional regulator [Methylobacterium sp. J-076]
MTSGIVVAYVSHNHVSPPDLPALIARVYGAITALAAGGRPETEEAAPAVTAAQIRKSVQADRLISFIDGKPYKTLKRHLTAHGLTPAAYRERFGLPADYPMVASDYSERRSSLAKAHGLGSAGMDRLAS